MLIVSLRVFVNKLFFLSFFSHFFMCSLKHWLSVLPVTCLDHGISVRGGSAGGEESPSEEAGWHTLPDGWKNSLGSRRQRPLHCQPPVFRHPLWVPAELKPKILCVCVDFKTHFTVPCVTERNVCIYVCIMCVTHVCRSEDQSWW